MVREVLETIPQSEVLSILPESAASLEALSSLGQPILPNTSRRGSEHRQLGSIT